MGTPGLQALLNSFASSLALVGTGAPTPGAPLALALSPDPLQVGLATPGSGLTRTTVLLKMLRFGDDSLPQPGGSIADFLAQANQVLGGQAMPAISVQLPGPALPGARIPVTQLSGGGGLNSLSGLTIAEDVPGSSTLTSQPSLGSDPATDKTGDVLSGVPGIVGVIESGLSQPLPLTVSLTWTFAVPGGPTAKVSNSSLSSLSVIPPIMFVDLGASTAFELMVSVTGTITVEGQSVSAPVDVPPTSFPFPGIPVPRLLGLFTWPLYGTQPAQGRSDPDQDSLLVMLPADSPLGGMASISSALTSLHSSVSPVLSLLGLPLPAGTISPFATQAELVGELTALVSGVGFLVEALARTASSGYSPVSIARANPTSASPVRGGLTDITQLWWHSYAFDTGHDYYHDNAQSFLWMAPPGSVCTVFRDTSFSSDPADPDQHGFLALTSGFTCLAGISDFRPHPSVVDPTLAPPGLGLSPASSASLTGFFTNEHPPTSEGDWAWTDSVRFT